MNFFPLNLFDVLINFLEVYYWLVPFSICSNFYQFSFLKQFLNLIAKILTLKFKKHHFCTNPLNFSTKMSNNNKKIHSLLKMSRRKSQSLISKKDSFFFGSALGFSPWAMDTFDIKDKW